MIAWAFEGGGFNGAVSSRLALRMERMGERPELLSGESIGAVLAYLIGVLGASDVDKLWDYGGADGGPLTAHDLYSGGGGVDKLLTLLGRRRGIYDMEPARRTLARLAADRRIRAGISVVVTVYDLRWRVLREHVLTSETPAESCVEMVYQSTLVPFAHGARDGRWADGGIGGAAPLGPLVREAKRRSVDRLHVEIFGLNPVGSEPWYGGSTLEEAARAVESIREEMIELDLLRTAQRVARPRPGDIPVTGRRWEPTMKLPDWMDASRQALWTRRNVAASMRATDLAAVAEEVETQASNRLRQSIAGA